MISVSRQLYTSKRTATQYQIDNQDPALSIGSTTNSTRSLSPDRSGDSTERSPTLASADSAYRDDYPRSLNPSQTSAESRKSNGLRKGILTRTPTVVVVGPPG